MKQDYEEEWAKRHSQQPQRLVYEAWGVLSTFFLT